MNEYNLNQLKILRQYFTSENIDDFIKIINPFCSCYELEILAKAYIMGVDISDLVNCHLSSDCLILLCDSKIKGIDIKGLYNEFIDVNLLSQIIKIKSENVDVDMSFIKDLSLDECKDLIANYRLFGISVLDKYRKSVQIDKKMIETELQYVVNMNKNK